MDKGREGIAKQYTKSEGSATCMRGVYVSLFNVSFYSRVSFFTKPHILLHMRLHRFFMTSPIEVGSVNHYSDPTLIHQLSHVFRLHDGHKAIFFDGTGADHECEIVSLNKSELVFRVIKTTEVKPFCERKVSLLLSLIKKDNFEWVIQKGTELGVSEFIPVVSERSEKKGFNIERATKIMIEAVEQSGQSRISTIHEPCTLADFLAEEKRPLIVFHTSGNDFIRQDILEHESIRKEVIVCVGPEGGWSDKELEMFVAKNATVVRLNTPVLRAETAAITVATLFLVK